MNYEMRLNIQHSAFNIQHSPPAPNEKRQVRQCRTWRSCLAFIDVEAAYAMYVLAVVLPPRPVQLVWKNSPHGLSTRSYV